MELSRDLKTCDFQQVHQRLTAGTEPAGPFGPFAPPPANGSPKGPPTGFGHAP